MKFLPRLLAIIMAMLATAAVTVGGAPASSARGGDAAAQRSAAITAAPVPPNCPDGYPVGNPGIGYLGTLPVMSVTQYYSPRCGANWSLVTVFNAVSQDPTVHSWETKAWIQRRGENVRLGESALRTSWVYTYSVPVGTASSCTKAVGTLRVKKRDPDSGVYTWRWVTSAPNGSSVYPHSDYRPAGCG